MSPRAAVKWAARLSYRDSQHFTCALGFRARVKDSGGPKMKAEFSVPGGSCLSAEGSASQSFALGATLQKKEWAMSLGPPPPLDVTLVL